MGVAANQARLMTLTARQHDLELRAQQISAMKMIKTMESQAMAIAYSDGLTEYSKMKSGELTKTGGTKYSDSECSSYLDTIKSTYDLATTAISSEEKILDMELTQINTEHTAIKTEYDAVKSLISDNVEKSFNVFG